MNPRPICQRCGGSVALDTFPIAPYCPSCALAIVREADTKSVAMMGGVQHVDKSGHKVSVKQEGE